MLPKRKYRSLIDVFDDFAGGFYNPQHTSYSFRGEVVDTDKYDIVPKRFYRDELIKQVEEEIETLDRDYKKERERLTEKLRSLKNKDG